MAKKRQGWEKKLYQGPPGSTASVLIKRAKDIKLDAPVTYGDTPDRGDGDHIPRADRGPVLQDCKITFSMNEYDGDASLIALVAAASNNTPTQRAIKYENPVTGTVFDGDCYIKYQDDGSMGSGGKHDFEAIPTSDGGREWTLDGYTGPTLS